MLKFLFRAPVAAGAIMGAIMTAPAIGAADPLAPGSDPQAIAPASIALLRALSAARPEANQVRDALSAARLRFQAVDVNGDGVQLTDLLYRTQLVAAARTYANIEQFFHTDLNGDGRSERAEIQAFIAQYADQFAAAAHEDEAIADLAARLAEVALRKYDRNGDDAADPVEVGEVERDFYEAARRVALSQVEAEFQVWLTFDANGDGIITFEEIEPHIRRAVLQAEGDDGADPEMG